MPQLVGCDCVVCHKQIRMDFDAEFCTECGNPVHRRCLSTDAKRLPDVQCLRCGGQRDSALARSLRAERREAEHARNADELRERGYPLGKVCPTCRSPEYTTTMATRWIAFQHDRVCKACRTRYTPPTPAWAAILFILIGSVFIVGMVFDWLLLIADLAGGRIHPARFIGSAMTLALGTLGVWAIRHGVQCLRDPATS
jgi:hypothetical protein